MKKTKLIFLLSFPFLLTGCNFIKFNFVNDPNNPSIDVLPDNNYEYFSGDAIPTSDIQFEEIYIKDFQDDSRTIIERDLDTNEVLNEIIDQDKVKSVDEVSYIRQGEMGLQIGNYANRDNGVLSLTFNRVISYIELYIQPRWIIKPVETGYQYAPDKHVAVNVNQTKFIKIDEIKEDDRLNVFHKCIYKLEPNTDKIKINVFGARIYLNKIVTYY